MENNLSGTAATETIRVAPKRVSAAVTGIPVINRNGNVAVDCTQLFSKGITVPPEGIPAAAEQLSAPLEHILA